MYITRDGPVHLVLVSGRAERRSNNKFCNTRKWKGVKRCDVELYLSVLDFQFIYLLCMVLLIGSLKVAPILKGSLKNLLG